MRKPSGYGPSLIVLATAIVVLVAGPAAVQELAYRQTLVEVKQASQRLNDNNILELLNQSYRDIATVVEPSVVHISAQQEIRTRRGQRVTSLSTGSGWVYDVDGHIVTNFHVIEDATRIEVQLQSGDLREATLLGADRLTDIAVLKVEPGRLHPALRGDAKEEVQQGDLVFAFGSPFDFRFSMSQGVVSGKGRTVGVIRDDYGRWTGYENFIQVDAAINPGNSGGPLTDYRGRVVGMNTAIATGRRDPSDPAARLDEGQSAGVGLAIPLYMIESAVEQIIESGTVVKGYLGVEPHDLDAAEIDYLHRRGRARLANHLVENDLVGNRVIVRNVPETGPARDADVRPYDVITAVNGHPIDSMGHLRAVISTMRPGESINLSIYRYDELTDSGEETVREVGLVLLDAVRVYGAPSPNHPRDTFTEVGIARMRSSTEQTSREYGTKHFEGVVIDEVVPGSRLEQSGVGPGSVIIAIQDHSLIDVDDFFDFISRPNNDLREGVGVTIITRDGTFKHPFRLVVEPAWSSGE